MKQLVYKDKIGVYNPTTGFVMTCQLTDNNNFYSNNPGSADPDPLSIKAVNYNHNHSALHAPVVEDGEEIFYHDLLVKAKIDSSGLIAMTFSVKF